MAAKKATGDKPRRKKPKRKQSPSAAVKSHFRANGYMVGDCERYIPGSAITQDMFGWVDVVAIGHGAVWFLQITSRENMPSRLNKIVGRGTKKDKDTGERVPDPASYQCARSLLEALRAGVRCSVFGVSLDGELHERILTFDDLSLDPASGEVIEHVQAPVNSSAALLARIPDLFPADAALTE